MPLSVQDDFPSLRSDPSLVYLDSAATTLKPQCVVDEVSWCLSEGTAPIYRGVHRRGVELTERFESARATIAAWFDVADDEVVLTSGATGAINLVRNGWRGLERAVTTVVEHHSNLLPWTRGLESSVLPCDEFGRISPNDLDRELAARPAQLVALTHVSNVLGTIQPVAEIAAVAHRHGAMLLLDAAQSVCHLPISPEECGADYIVCSAHKMLGPSGVGALIASPEALERLDPVNWGGGMVESVTHHDAQLQAPPRRFEAGTPPVEAVLGWAAALEYMESLGREAVARHLDELTRHGLERLQSVDGVRVLGPANAVERTGILTLEIDGWEAHAAARVLSQRANVCVRSGFHCAEPLHQHLGLKPTLRLSLHVYSSLADIDKAVGMIEQLSQVQVG